MTLTNTRADDLRRTLLERRRELRDGRERRVPEGRDTGIELELVLMKAETLARIETALVRLEAGTYGLCFECDAQISTRRLQALPFALRCQACEEQRDHERESARRLERGDLPLFAAMNRA